MTNIIYNSNKYTALNSTNKQQKLNEHIKNDKTKGIFKSQVINNMNLYWLGFLTKIQPILY